MKQLLFVRVLFVSLSMFLMLFSGMHAHGQNAANSPQTPHTYSTNIYGAYGLNTIPSARSAPVGTVQTQLSFSDPYVHGFLGIQIADPLFIGIRQSAEFSSLNDDAKKLAPGIDAKLRLLTETRSRPELAFGVQSGFGHKRMAGEYLAASKRYRNFDFTGGLGWGRFASAAKLDNPLKIFGSHFNRKRALDGEDANTPDDWLTGEDLGIFAGVEYFTPITGLSLKADIGSDQYAAESAAFDYDTPAPWSAGLNYRFLNIFDFGVAAQGLDKVMARLSIRGNVKNLRDKSAQYKKSTPRLNPHRSASASPGQIALSAQHDNQALEHITTNQTTATGVLTYNHAYPAPLQLRRAATHIANHAGPTVEDITITPISQGLRGPDITLARSSLEKALSTAPNPPQGSSNEIWHDTTFTPGFNNIQSIKPQSELAGFFDALSLTLDNHISISEEETSLLRRSSLILKTDTPLAYGSYFASGFGLRLNIGDNIGKLDQFRASSAFPIRSDVDKFAERRWALENAYVAFNHTLAPDVHMRAISGYIEEMFAGSGAEILYRPYNKRYAIGAESWLAAKRDPYTTLNLGLYEQGLFTAHVNGWYDIPEIDTTASLKFGRYLAKDIGIQAALTKRFKNGAKIETYLSLSDKSDSDPFGGDTHADHGIRVSLPLGGYKYTPNMHINTLAAPFGRDIGQTINNPLPLYESTQKFSLSHMANHWDGFDQQ